MAKTKSKPKEERRWGYTVSRWWGHPHFHVTLFPDGPFNEFFTLGSGVCHSQKFNTQEDYVKFVAFVRAKLRRKGVALKLHRKELDK